MRRMATLRMAALVVGSAGVGFVITRAVRAAATQKTEGNATSVVRALRLPSGETWLVVYLAASWCAASQAPSLPQNLRDAVARVRGDTTRGPVSTLGVALDWDPQLGWEYLAKFRVFDEVAIGRNWANIGATRFVWQAGPPVPTLPQIAIVRQSWRSDSLGVALLSESIVQRIVGPEAIQAWADTVSVLPRVGLTPLAEVPSRARLAP